MEINFSANPDLEFEDSYSEIEFILSRSDANDAPLNNEVVAAVSWPYIHQQCQQLLLKGFDLRVFLWKLRADLNLQGLSALWVCLDVLENAFTHLPQNDPQRLNASMGLAWLQDSQCLLTVKLARLIPESLFTLDHIERKNLYSDTSNSSNTFSEWITTIDQVDSWYQSNNLPSLEIQLRECIQKLDALTQTINSVSEGMHFNPHRLLTYLQSSYTSLQEKDLSRLNETTQVTLSKDPSADTPLEHLNNRREAVLMLDNVLAYFEKHEPSHPAPVLIRRARKMIGMDFSEIIEELLPEAVNSLQQFAGRS